MINLQRRLLWFDLETTGLDVRNDRIVSIAFREYKPGEPAGREYYQVLNPGIPIPKEASDIHGITDEDVVGKPSFSELAPHLLKGFRDCDYGGYNVRQYDLPLLSAEFTRAGHEWNYNDAGILDVMKLWDVLERRSLVRAVERFLGREHAGAHDANADIDETIQVFEAMLTQFRGKIPPTVAEIHQLLFPRDPNAIDPRGQIVWKGDEAVINFGKKWKGTPLTKMSRRDLEWIANTATGVCDEAKAICRDCLAGKFPTKQLPLTDAGTAVGLGTADATI